MAPGRATPTTRGWYLAGAMVVIVLLGAWTGRNELYALAASGFAVILTSGSMLPRSRGFLALLRTELVPPQAAVGSTVVGRLILTNGGKCRWPAANLTLALDPIGSSYNRAPAVIGFRPYAHRNDPVAAVGYALDFAVPAIKPGESVVARFKLPTERRGVWRLGLVTVTAADPLGLFERSWSRQVGCCFVAHPKVRPADRVLPMLAADAPVPSALSGQPRQRGDDLRTVREFQDGDDFRLVHWRATARWGRLMVREQQFAPGCVVDVAIDLRAGSHTPASLERVLEDAASLACAVLADPDARARLVTTGGEHIGPGSGEMFRIEVLSFLAAAALHDGPPKPVQSAKRPGSTMLITSTSSAARELVSYGKGTLPDGTVLVVTEEIEPAHRRRGREGRASVPGSLLESHQGDGR
ncbi:MAG TPA: DUF58 domain-containing protein [Acidimicrobiales bacterium]|nr:DUF58 domain-containing protein [Acidimicrobiales bacterium]